MSGTTTIKGDFVIGVGQKDVFTDQTAYLLKGPDAFLDNRGAIEIDLDAATTSSFGILSSGSGSRVLNEGGASFVMTATGAVAAVGINASLASFENDGTWSVASSGGPANAVSLRSAGDFTNGGVISARGAFATAVQAADAGVYLNTGTISAVGAKGDAVGVALHNVSDAAFSFSNDGTISATGHKAGSDGTYALGFSGAEGVQWQFENSGALKSDGYAFIELQEGSTGTQTEEVFRNSGKMFGAVDMGLGDDQLINTGTIKGEVSLGAGDDVYSGAHGKLEGAMDGGGGADVLIGGKGGDLLHGGAGNDEVQGGAGRDLLFGDDGDDTLYGGGGSDTMTGGAGDDTFVFRTIKDLSFPVDSIVDLQDTDVIDLSAIDADTTTKGNQAFHLVANFTHHAGEAVLFYQSTDPGFTILQLDVDGDGQEDGEIVMNDNHMGFTNFVL